jgi:hypothetical protein
VVARTRASETQRAIGQLVVGAFFFATRSCEYSEASGSRRTKTVRIGDIVFRLGGEPIRSVKEEVLAGADTVSVTYRTQKNSERGVTVTQHRTRAQPGMGLCPVVSRISAHEYLSSYVIFLSSFIGIFVGQVPWLVDSDLISTRCEYSDNVNEQCRNSVL